MKKDFELSLIFGIIMYILFVLPNINHVRGIVGLVEAPSLGGPQPAPIQPPAETMTSKLASVGIITNADLISDANTQNLMLKTDESVEIQLSLTDNNQLQNFRNKVNIIDTNKDIMISKKGDMRRYFYIDSIKLGLKPIKSAKITFDISKIKPANLNLNNPNSIKILKFTSNQDIINFIYRGKGGIICPDCYNLKISSDGKTVSFNTKGLSGYGLILSLCPEFDEAGCISDDIPPVINLINFLPSNPTTLDSIMCRFNIVDPVFLAPLTSNVTIFNGTIPLNSSIVNVINGTNQTVIVNYPHKKKETWGCSVEPYDGNNYGLVALSNFVTIRNTPPTQSQPSFEFVNSTIDNIYCNILNVNDADNDDVHAIYSYYVNTLPLNALYLSMEGNISNNLTKDYSGDNMTVMSYGGAHPVAGDFGDAFNFDGINDYLMILDHEDIEYDENESFTIEAWIRTISPSKQVILSKFHPTNSYYIWYTQNGKLFLNVSNGTLNKVFNGTNTSLMVNDGFFHHVAVRLNKHANTIRAYVDGSPTLNIQLGLRGNIGFNNANLYIGALNWNSNLMNLFNGDIDEVLFYNYPVHPDQILYFHAFGMYNTISENEIFGGEEWKCRVFLNDDDSETYSDSGILNIPSTYTPPGGGQLPGEGPGSGPGGGGTGPEYGIFLFDLNQDTTKTFNVGRLDNIFVKGLAVTYKISINKIQQSYATLFVYPKARTLKLGADETLDIDLDVDGSIDIVLDIVSLGSTQVGLKISKYVLAQSVTQQQQGVTQTQQTQGQQQPDQLEKPTKPSINIFKKDTKLWIAIGLIVVIIIAVLLVWNKLTPENKPSE